MKDENAFAILEIEQNFFDSKNQVYFKLTNFDQYLEEGKDPARYDYQDDCKFFICPSHNCSSMADLLEIIEPTEMKQRDQMLLPGSTTQLYMLYTGLEKEIFWSLDFILEPVEVDGRNAANSSLTIGIIVTLTAVIVLMGIAIAYLLISSQSRTDESEVATPRQNGQDLSGNEIEMTGPKVSQKMEMKENDQDEPVITELSPAKRLPPPSDDYSNINVE